MSQVIMTPYTLINDHVTYKRHLVLCCYCDQDQEKTFLFGPAILAASSHFTTSVKTT